jgi:hypothetical protein
MSRCPGLGIVLGDTASFIQELVMSHQYRFGKELKAEILQIAAERKAAGRPEFLCEFPHSRAPGWIIKVGWIEDGKAVGFLDSTSEHPYHGPGTFATKIYQDTKGFYFVNCSQRFRLPDSIM